MAGKEAVEPPSKGGFSTEDFNIWNRWKSEIEYARKDAEYVSWIKRCEQIVARYRDQRNRASLKLRRFNVLWSNVQTLKPLIFSRSPKPVVERRHMDRDPSGRLASQMLERCLSFQIESSRLYDHVSKSVEDYLLTGIGQAWLRYDPSFESVEDKTKNKAVTPKPSEPNYVDKINEDGDGTSYEKLAYETVCIDYVFYRDFLWGNARTWPEVPWVARRTWLTRSEVKEQYGEEKSKQIVLDFTPPKLSSNEVTDDQTLSYFKKAEVWELWNKADRKVYIIPIATPGLVLDIKDDPLKLEDFWPCPEPLFATQTSDTVVPIPDYYEYQDQAQELDDLTNRIAMLTTAVRANGFFDSAAKGGDRLLQEGVDNKLIPVDNWAAFQEKGGAKGFISLVPMGEIMEVLNQLYVSRQQVLNDLYQITGLSDLVRGMGDPNETATAQRIKGQFASNRLQARQEAVARYCRDILRIMGEMIAEIFSEETLLTMSGLDLQFRDEVRKAQQSVPQPPPPQLPPEAQQAPAEMQQALMAQMQQQVQQQYQMQVQQAGQAKEQELMAEFQEALRILRDDKLRGFRIDIETDSTVSPDAEQAKQSATELYTAVLQGMEGAAPVIAQAPEMFDVLEQLFLYVYRTYRVGRSAEASLEQAFDKMRQRIEQQSGNPPPSPEMIKAQAEQQKLQLEMEQSKQDHQLEMQSKQLDMQIEREKGEMQLQLERERVELERLKGQQEMELEAARMGIEEQKLQYKQRDLELQERANVVTTGIKVRGAEEMARIKRQNAQRPTNGGAQ